MQQHETYAIGRAGLNIGVDIAVDGLLNLLTGGAWTGIEAVLDLFGLDFIDIVIGQMVGDIWTMIFGHPDPPSSRTMSDALGFDVYWKRSLYIQPNSEQYDPYKAYQLRKTIWYLYKREKSPLPPLPLGVWNERGSEPTIIPTQALTMDGIPIIGGHWKNPALQTDEHGGRLPRAYYTRLNPMLHKSWVLYKAIEFENKGIIRFENVPAKTYPLYPKLRQRLAEQGNSIPETEKHIEITKQFLLQNWRYIFPPRTPANCYRPATEYRPTTRPDNDSYYITYMAREMIGYDRYDWSKALNMRGYLVNIGEYI